MSLIQSIKENCKLCYACIRVCPSRAIIIEDQHAQVLHDRCIGCGHCVSVCTPKALRYIDSIEATEKLLRSDYKVIAICAPSIPGEFSDISSRRNFTGMIKALGFDHVCEVAFGADLVALKYKELLSDFKGKYYITTNCPSVVYNVEKFHPESITNLVRLVSPMIAMAKVVHKKYGADAKVVYIGPCIAAKREATRATDDGKVDEVLTFVELRKIFEKYNIKENSVEYSDFDPPHGRKGYLFPIHRGMFQAVDIDESHLTGRVVSTEGRFNFIEAIKEFENLQSLKKHIDLFYCDGGCTMGPGTSPDGQKFHRRSLVIDYTKRRLESGDKELWKKDIEEYIQLNFRRTYEADDQRTKSPSPEKIQKVLVALGKPNKEDHIDCGACGYETCKEFAGAVSQHFAKPDMCIIFNIKNKQDYIKNLKVANEKLEKTRQALEESEKNAQHEKEVVKAMSITTNTMLQKIPSGVVLVDQELKIISSNMRFIALLGEDAENIAEVIPALKGADLKTLLPPNIINLFKYVIDKNDGVENRDIQINEQLLTISIFPITKGEVAGAVIRDMQLPEVRREEVINRITEAIDKNLKMVQNIGFLLGEGASETEKMLNSIVKSYKPGKK
ncbi:MAG: 4Fe-4S dicluster domain-containing protein [Salinivirgaceae bacterium]|nr:4Fe-4S dicluster domain-containing protein [Salinivirgaceae bacterium]